ncbi:MAG: cyclic nucleotide-binding domain-containing protein [Methyloligella sp. ZOD6]
MVTDDSHPVLLASAGLPVEKFAAGEVIIPEGSQGDKMYVVCSGKVRIERAGKLLEELSPGDSFGEMSLIDGAPRSATARAEIDCEVAPIAERMFLRLVHEKPMFALTIMHNLADRLRRANERWLRELQL